MVDVLKTHLAIIAFFVFIGTESLSAIRITRKTRDRNQRKTRITSVKVRNYYGPKYKSSYWKTGMAVGLVFGIASYKTRRRYLRYPDREPTICFNEEDLRNGTYGYFICPEWNQPDDYEYCCGDAGNQRCCTYFGREGGDGATGRIVVIVVAVILVCSIIGIAIYCFNARRRRKTTRGQVITDNRDRKGLPADQSIPLNTRTEPSPYPTGSSMPNPVLYGCYGTGMQDLGGVYTANTAPYPTAAMGYSSGYSPGGFSGGVMKQPLPSDDITMVTSLPYPQDPGLHEQGSTYPPYPTTALPPPYPGK